MFRKNPLPTRRIHIVASFLLVAVCVTAGRAVADGVGRSAPSSAPSALGTAKGAPPAVKAAGSAPMSAPSALGTASGALQAGNVGGSAPSSAPQTGILLLGALFGYFLVYSINVGSKAVDALKSLLGVLGIASGGLLALWPSPSNQTDAATKLLDSATNLAKAVQPLAGKAGGTVTLPDQLVTQISGMLQAATKVATTNAPQSSAAGGVLDAYTEGAVIGFGIYVIIAIALAALYSRKYEANALNRGALFAETLAKTLLGEDFRPAPVH